MTMRGAEQQARLEGELRQAGLRYRLDRAAGGRPVAGFRYAEAGGPALAVTAEIRNGALALRCEVAAQAAALLAAVNDGWWLGRAWLAEDGRVALAAGYPAFPTDPAAGALRQYLGALYAIAGALAAADVTAGIIGDTAAMTRAFLPDCNTDSAIVAIAAALHGAGQPLREANGPVLWQRFAVAGSGGCLVTISPADGPVLRVETTVEVASPAGAAQLHQLNRLTPIGAFAAGAAEGVLHHRWAYSPAHIPASARFAAWLIEVAAQMAFLAQQTLGTPGDGPRA